MRNYISYALQLSRVIKKKERKKTRENFSKYLQETFQHIAFLLLVKGINYQHLRRRARDQNISSNVRCIQDTFAVTRLM